LVICEQGVEMISVLVVGAAQALEEVAARNPSVEVLTARGLEETLEKLGRNRRIDAVLLLEREGAQAIVEGIRDDNPAHPPIFVPAGEEVPAGARALPACSQGQQLLDVLSRELQA
jgi:hypothetical protein